MRKDFRCQSHRNPFDPLGQQKREFHRKGDRLFIAPVVRQFPVGGFRVKKHFQRKFRQARLDVTRGCRAIASEYIAPVSLAIDQQVFLAQLHQRIADRRVAVRVVLHGLPNNVGHLVITTVVHYFHGM